MQLMLATLHTMPETMHMKLEMLHSMLETLQEMFLTQHVLIRALLHLVEPIFPEQQPLMANTRFVMRIVASSFQLLLTEATADATNGALIKRVFY